MRLFCKLQPVLELWGEGLLTDFVHCSLETFIRWSLGVLSFLWFHSLVLILPLEATEAVSSLSRGLEAAAVTAVAMPDCLSPCVAEATPSRTEDSTFCRGSCSQWTHRESRACGTSRLVKLVTHLRSNQAGMWTQVSLPPKPMFLTLGQVGS